MARFLKTDNGPHPPEQWAMATTDTIFDVANSALVGERLLQAQRLRLAIAESLIEHHRKVQVAEQGKLATNVDSIHTMHCAKDFLDPMMNDIVSVSKGTPWEQHFLDPDVQIAVKEAVADHFVTSQHIERLWHADRNPDCEVSQRYKARFHKQG